MARNEAPAASLHHLISNSKFSVGLLLTFAALGNSFSLNYFRYPLNNEDDERNEIKYDWEKTVRKKEMRKDESPGRNKVRNLQTAHNYCVFLSMAF